MSRPLLVKVAGEQRSVADSFSKVDGEWKKNRLMFTKKDGSWMHKCDFLDYKEIAPADCETGTKYRYDCPCGCAGNQTLHKDDALGHDWEYSHTVKPDCTNGGYTVDECTRCGDTDEYNYTGATGHELIADEETYVAPTCKSEGSQTYVCGCGYSEVVTYAKVDHKYINGSCVWCGISEGGSGSGGGGGIEVNGCTCGAYDWYWWGTDEDGLDLYQCTWCGGLSYGDECLISGTQILMSDFRVKSIETVQAGDMVKSWDLEEGAYMDVKVLGAFCTGTAKEWTVHTFDNGKTLTIHNKHRIYCKEKNSIRESSEWRMGNTAIATGGVETKYCEVQTRTDESRTKRYTLITENNLYFANSILCGHHPKAKYKYYSQGLLKATPEEAERYKATARMYEAMDKALTHEEYLKQAAPLRAQLLKAKEDIRCGRHEISRLDHEAHRRGRGRMSDKEWNDHNMRRDNHRRDIDRIKAESQPARVELNRLKEKFGITTKTKYEIFAEAYKLDMDYIKAKRKENV